MSTNTSPSSANQKSTSAPLTKEDRLWRARRKGRTPPARISVAEWADRNRRLAKESGNSTGKWRTSTVEAARGPMLAVTEPGVHVITVMVSTQMLKTSLLENVFGYFAHLDPCPILLLQPKEDAAEQFSKERIAPLIRVTPVLKDLVGTGKMRSADETLLYKSFPGGFLALAGAGSPDNLARRPIRVLLADEIDKYPITREGDPIALAEERTASFGSNWLSVGAGSPTVEDESRIADSYEESDQRRASVACPHCGHRQFLDFFRHVEWNKEGNQHHPKTARIFCEACAAMWSEGARLARRAGTRRGLSSAAASGMCRWSCTKRRGKPTTKPPSTRCGPGGRAIATPCIARYARIAGAWRWTTSTPASTSASSIVPGLRTSPLTSRASGSPRKTTRTRSRRSGIPSSACRIGGTPARKCSWKRWRRAVKCGRRKCPTRPRCSRSASTYRIIASSWRSSAGAATRSRGPSRIT